MGLALLRPGPHLRPAARFDPRYFAHVFRDTALRRANFGYLGHMFELYAMWTWAPRLLQERLAESGWSSQEISLAAFFVIAVGGIGSVVAGWQADRVGRTTITIVSLLISGTCALMAGHLLDAPTVLLIVCLLWGFSVVADSAQFSAAVSELCEPTLVGTALTIQTCTGFLLTTVTIRMIPTVRELAGWPWAMSLLAIGPVFGIWHLVRLRRMPDALRLAHGKR
jgi:MFS family permease